MGLKRPRTLQPSNPAEPNWSDHDRPVTELQHGVGRDDLRWRFLPQLVHPKTHAATSTTSPGIKVGFSRPPPRSG